MLRGQSTYEALKLQFQLATLSTPGTPIDMVEIKTSCDLHNEHVNKLFMEVISNMGANFTEAASTRTALAVTSLAHTAETFDSETGIHLESTAHIT